MPGFKPEELMALSAATVPVDTVPSSKVEQPTIELELAIYDRYSRQGVLYVAQTEDGRPQTYRFTTPQAKIVLQDVDDVSGRPIWRKPRKRVTEVQKQVDRNVPKVFDATKDQVKPIEREETVGYGMTETLQDGNDSELLDIPGLIEASSEDRTI
jgi:hypothetical protein